MPVSQCNGKWRIGDGECTFSSKAKAEAAFKHWVETQNGTWDPGDGAVIIKHEGWETAVRAVALSKQFGKTITVSQEAFEVYDQEHPKDA